jgi:hypothetical protein
MRYEVTYQLGGEERVDKVDAPDAAAAAAMVREAHGHSAEMFELILVHLVDEMPNAGEATPSARPSGA